MATQKPRKTGTKAVTKRAQRKPSTRPAAGSFTPTAETTALAARISALEHSAANTAGLIGGLVSVPKTSEGSLLATPSTGAGEMVERVRGLSNLVDEVRGDFDRIAGRLAPVCLPPTPGEPIGSVCSGAAPVVPTSPLEDELDDLRRNIRELQRRILRTNDALVI